MNEKIKDIILESLTDSINEARKYITSYERVIARDYVDTTEYMWWCQREENLMEAYKVVSEMETKEDE